MKLADVICYVQKLFESYILVALAAIGSSLFNFLLPTHEYRVSAISVLCVFVLDILTRLLSLARQEGGLRKAIKTRRIRSERLAKGTLDKLIVFGVMLIICGLLYQMSILSEVAVWFTQLVFLLMFFRDVLSILENLSDSGIEVGIFKHIVKKKMKEYVCEEEIDKICKDKTEAKKDEEKQDTTTKG